MVDLMDPSHSWSKYRNALKEAREKSAIPYLGVYLTDLTFIDEGNPDVLDGKINLSKRELCYKVCFLVLCVFVGGLLQLMGWH